MGCGTKEVWFDKYLHNFIAECTCGVQRMSEVQSIALDDLAQHIKDNSFPPMTITNYEDDPHGNKD